MSATQKTNVGLDVMRGIASLLVILGHSRVFVGSSLSVDLTETAWQKILLLPTSFAQESVAVFFVLSGYLVGGQVLREVASGKFGWRLYMSKRISRLWTVLIPGIALTFALDGLTNRMFANVWDRLAGNASDASAIVCNAVFLQVTRCNTYGSNDSLWSLSYEFWFYVIFAGATVSVWGFMRKQWVSAFVGVLVCIGTVTVFGVGLFTLIPSWLLGVVLAVVHRRWKNCGIPRWVPDPSPRTILMLAAVMVAGMLASNLSAPPEWARFVIVGCACAPLILATAIRPWGNGSRVAHRVAGIGVVSFSLYVFHLPIVKFLAGAYAQTGGLGSGWDAVIVYALAAAVFALCLPLWYITERNTATVRAWMLRLFAVRPVAMAESR